MNLCKKTWLISSTIFLSAYIFFACSKNTTNSQSPNTQNSEKTSSRIANTMSESEFQDKFLNELSSLGDFSFNAVTTNSNFIQSSQNLSLQERIEASIKHLKNQQTLTGENLELSENGYKRDSESKEALQFLWSLLLKELFTEIETLKLDTSKILTSVSACEPTTSLKAMCYQGMLSFSELTPLLRYTVQQLKIDPSFEPKFTLWMAGDKSKLDLELFIESQNFSEEISKQNRRGISITIKLDTSKHAVKLEWIDHVKYEEYQEKQILNFEMNKKQNFEGQLKWEQKIGSSNEYSTQIPSLKASKFAWAWDIENNELWTRFIEQSMQRDDTLR